MSAIATSAPSRAKRSAIARPKPLAPPVIRAVLPSSSFIDDPIRNASFALPKPGYERGDVLRRRAAAPADDARPLLVAPAQSIGEEGPRRRGVVELPAGVDPGARGSGRRRAADECGAEAGAACPGCGLGRQAVHEDGGDPHALEALRRQPEQLASARRLGWRPDADVAQVGRAGRRPAVGDPERQAGREELGVLGELEIDSGIVSSVSTRIRSGSASAIASASWGTNAASTGSRKRLNATAQASARPSLARRLPGERDPEAGSLLPARAVRIDQPAPLRPRGCRRSARCSS